MKEAYEIMDEEPEGKLPFVRTRCRWKDNTEMDNKKNKVEEGRLDPFG